MLNTYLLVNDNLLLLYFNVEGIVNNNNNITNDYEKLATKV